MRVRITKATKKYNLGQIIDVSKNEGFGLIDSGHAVVSKDISQSDIRTKRGRSS